jgi:hypothetical protein
MICIKVFCPERLRFIVLVQSGSGITPSNKNKKKKLKNTINLWFFCIGLQLNCAFNVISASYNYDNDFPLFVNLHLFIQTEHFHVQFLEK